MSSVTTASFVQVWGVDLSGQVFVLGTIGIDRTAPTVAYTAGTGPEQCTFGSEPAAAAWLARRASEYPFHVFIGRWMTMPYDDWATNQPTPHDEPEEARRLREAVALLTGG